MSKMRITGFALLSVALLAGAAEMFIKDDKLVASVEGQIRKLQPTRAEKRYDEVGWAPSILAAEQIAAKLNRPAFLFTYNGKIDTGRC